MKIRNGLINYQKEIGQSNVYEFDFYRLVKLDLTPHNGTPTSASTLSLYKLSATFIM